ncbi:hypothetical protein MJH12_08025, partial [bacterium]|nr:hypothetical protein [bacterium]
MKNPYKILTVFILTLNCCNSAQNELKEMKSAVIELIQSNMKIIKFLRNQEKNNFKVLDDQ